MQTVDRLISQFQPESYNLELTLSRQERTFSGQVTINGTIGNSSNTIRLHAKDLTIIKASVNEQSASISSQKDQAEITLSTKNHFSGEVAVMIEFGGVITDAMHGLYPCYFEHNGQKKELLATQFESHHAREVFPCIDEPEAKATFRVTLITEPDVTVLGNMPIQTQKSDNDLLITTFETSPRMSVYLVAFVVGEMHNKAAVTNNGTLVRVWATPLQPLTSLDFALQSAVRTIEFFNDYFGVPYPLPKSDHVALPDFASGAMENWGLITYREVALLVDPATTSVSLKEYVAIVVAHELSHQWFGNLVTMKWWDDLWLNESFASLMEYVAVDALYPEWNIWLTFTSGDALAALRRDSIKGVQSVKTEVNHPDEIGTLFDAAIVYAKGARLLYMLYHYVGQSAFRKGLSDYFNQFKYSNTTGLDLWTALAGASGKNVAGFMDKWLIQPGFPLVLVTQEDSKLQLKQQRFRLQNDDPLSAELWPIPLKPSISQKSIPELFDRKEANYNLPANQIVRLNSGGIGHYSVRYETAYQRQSIARSVEEGLLDPAERLLLLNDGAMQARAGIGSISEVLGLLSSYANETSEPVWDMITLIIADTRRLIEGDDELENKFKSFIRRLINSEYQRLGWNETDGETNSDTKLRATILGLGIYSEDQAIITEAKRRYTAAEDISALPAEIRGVILSAVIRHDDQTINAFENLLHIHNTTANAELKQEVASSLTSTKDRARIKQLLGFMRNQKIVRLQDIDHWFVWLIRNRYARDLTWQWMTGNWQWIEQNFAHDKSYENFPRYAASAFSTEEWLERYRRFFDPFKEQPALKRTIAMGLSDIESRAEWRQRDRKNIEQFLANLYS